MVNEWTRDDLPHAQWLHDTFYDKPDSAMDALERIAVDLVAYLNANNHKPAPGTLWATKADADRDRWRRAHAIVEQERDQARERLREVDSALAKCMSDFQDMEDDSYEWKARAVAAEREVGALSERAEHLQHSRDEWKARAEKDATVIDGLKLALANRASRAEAAGRERDEALEASALFQRDVHEWRTRAEAAEARTARTVTREDVEKAMADAAPGLVPYGAWVDAAHALVSGDDPAVYVVRESDISAVEVAHDERGWHARGATWSREPTAEGVRDGAKRHLRDVARYEALARAIEAEPAVDPLLDKAQEFVALAAWELTDREAVLLHKVAAHVLGQEDRHVDQ